MFVFGSGVMTVTPSGTLQTPINIGLLQEGSVDFQQEVKPLYGQYKDPIALGSGTRKWTGKAKVARLSGRILNALMFGTTLATGQTATAYESDTVPAVSTYTVTVANSSTWTVDQGVIYTATGLPLTRVATVTAAGQYSVAAGVYTFYSGDASAKVTIAYNYTVSASGQSILVPQSLLGATLSFALNFTTIDPTTNAIFTGQFFNCVATKFSFATKLEDFAMPDFEFMLAANAGGNVGQFNFPDTF
jgi:hypothetical protein